MSYCLLSRPGEIKYDTFENDEIHDNEPWANEIPPPLPEPFLCTNKFNDLSGEGLVAELEHALEMQSKSNTRGAKRRQHVGTSGVSHTVKSAAAARAVRRRAQERDFDPNITFPVHNRSGTTFVFHSRDAAETSGTRKIQEKKALKLPEEELRKLGSRLYSDSHGLQRRHQEQKALAEKHRIEKENAECTFKPSVTAIAQTVYKDAPNANNFGERLGGKDGIANWRNRAAAQAKHTNDGESKNCTFQPKINQKGSMQSGMDIGDRLYAEGNGRIIRQQLREKQIGAWERDAAIGGNALSQRQISAAVDRLYDWNKQREDFVELLRDEVTKPKYSVHCDTAAVVARLATPTIPARLPDQGDCEEYEPKISVASTMIAEKRRRQRYEALFSKFDVDGIGSVSFVSLQQQVRELFPEHTEMLTALRQFAADGSFQVIDVESFCELLGQYEKRYGPQNWSRSDRLRKEEILKCEKIPGKSSNVHERLFQLASKKKQHNTSPDEQKVVQLTTHDSKHSKTTSNEIKRKHHFHDIILEIEAEVGHVLTSPGGGVHRLPPRSPATGRRAGSPHTMKQQPENDFTPQEQVIDSRSAIENVPGVDESNFSLEGGYNCAPSLVATLYPLTVSERRQAEKMCGKKHQAEEMLRDLGRELIKKQLEDHVKRNS